jgi:hypothetical protein
LYSSALQSIEEWRIDNCKETLSDINSMQHSKSYFDGEMKSFRTPKQVKLDY